MGIVVAAHHIQFDEKVAIRKVTAMVAAPAPRSASKAAAPAPASAEKKKASSSLIDDRY